MTATVTDIMPPRSVTVPRLTAGRRRVLLEALAEQEMTGIPRPADEVAVLVAAYASDRLTAGQAQGLWLAFLAEWERVAEVEANELDYRTVCTQMCREDRAAAVNDLVNGTDTYRGTR